MLKFQALVSKNNKLPYDSPGIRRIPFSVNSLAASPVDPLEYCKGSGWRSKKLLSLLSQHQIDKRKIKTKKQAP